MGRPMIADVARYASGRINQNARAKIKPQDNDAGNASPKVKRACDLFNAPCFKGGGQGHKHAGDAIGVLWLLGRLDVDGVDETRFLAAARAWWRGYEATYPEQGYKTANFERTSQSSAKSTKMSKDERDYAHYESILRANATDYERGCLYLLMKTNIDDDMPSWVSRVVQTDLLKFFRFPLLALAMDDDYRQLEAAKRALVAMIGEEAVRKVAA